MKHPDTTDKGPAKIIKDQHEDWYWLVLNDIDSPLCGPHMSKQAAINAAVSLGYTYNPPTREGER